MKERPILFSSTMIQALMAGTKTQTRRIVKLKPGQQVDERDDGSSWPWTDYDGADMWHWLPCPYGQPGDRLWVREAFAGSIAYERHGYPLKEWGNKLWYLADGEPRSGQWTRPRPSIHMPRCLSRITLEITEVRVERLQDISEADALAEGCVARPAPEPYRDACGELVVPHDPTAKEAFRALWESLHGPDSWTANPWVWVVGFRRVT